jgi:hypothetical protein
MSVSANRLGQRKGLGHIAFVVEAIDDGTCFLLLR